MNRKRDATAVATVTWPQLGYASNQYVRVFDAWSQTTVGTYSNAFTHTIPTNTADLFVFTPVSAIAVTQIVTYASCPIDNGTRSAFGGSYFDAVWLWASDPASMDVYVPVPTGFAHALMTTSFARSAADYSQVGIVTIYGDGSGGVVGENSQSVNFVSTGNTNFLATISTPLPSTTQNRFIRIRWPQGTNTLGIRQLQNSVKLVLTPAQ
jgi:hypothetical protein